MKDHDLSIKRVFCHPPGCRCLVVSSAQETLDIPDDFSSAVNVYDNDIEGIILKINPTVSSESVQAFIQKIYEQLEDIQETLHHSL